MYIKSGKVNVTTKGRFIYMIGAVYEEINCLGTQCYYFSGFLSNVKI